MKFPSKEVWKSLLQRALDAAAAYGLKRFLKK